MNRLIFFAIRCLALIGMVASIPYTDCPEWMAASGIVNDIGLLSDAVSWNNDGTNIHGVCDEYRIVYDKSGRYDTRMRIYEALYGNTTAIVFRPTQQTWEGGQIHDNRVMSPCVFIPSCVGKVHDRFQQAFLSLSENEDQWMPYLNNRYIITAGHSLGGALQLFMSIFLFNKYSILPYMSLGFAGPFIGDIEFSDAYQDVLYYMMDGRWWQIETVDRNNPSNFDGTTESYQVAPQEPQLFIERAAVCGFPIQPLPIPDQAYGMHDLKQYRLFTSGTECPVVRRYNLKHSS